MKVLLAVGLSAKGADLSSLSLAGEAEKLLVDSTGLYKDTTHKYIRSTNTRLNPNIILNQFFNSTDEFLIISKPLVFKEYKLRGNSNLIAEFIDSYKYNKLPVQLLYMEDPKEFLYEDEYTYSLDTFQNITICVTREIAEKAGYMELDYPSPELLWASRLLTLAGRHPETYPYLKHSARYRQYVKQAEISLDRKSHERMQEIYKGINLTIKKSGI